MKLNRVIAMVLAVAMVFSLAACGKSSPDDSSAAGSTDFTYLILSSIDGVWYDDYDENPAAQYWLSREWDADGDGQGTKISVDFWAPVAGSESDYVNTLISTGEYPDVMSLTHSNETAMKLYEEGIALDLTDYVNAYMPNYLAFVESHPELHFTNLVDGEAKYIQLYNGSDAVTEPWGGFMYRRDWIVKYGSNPKTGEAFHGEWADGEWADNVVFPSGNTDPTTITDWEWMLGIFEAALDALGATDGYPMQLSYAGVNFTGDLVSGFGGIGPRFYYDDNGDIAFGATSDGLRAYIECMATWYANGWIDAAFAERANDMFFMIDAATVYSGKVGLWYGLASQLLDSLDPGDGSNPYLDGAVIYACASPVNDKYGEESVQGTEPVTFFQDDPLVASFIITDKAKDKDIATLLTAIDYFYSDEGSLLFSQGLSKEILDANPDAPYTQTYIGWGLEDGAYTLNGDKIVVNPVITGNADDLRSVARCSSMAGKFLNENIDYGYSDTKQYQLDIWTNYHVTGTIQNDIISQLDTDASASYSTFNTNMYTIGAQWIPQFIMGKLDVTNDADWQSYVNEMNALHPDEVMEALQTLVEALR